MSKIYDKYVKLKSELNNNNTLYLFKCGIFFIFIDNDAKIVSNYLNLKLSNLNNNIVKCGFPINSLSKYISLLKNIPYEIEIVHLDSEKTLSTNNYIYYEKLKNIVNDLIHINIDSLSISQAYDVLYDMQNKLILLQENDFSETNE